MLIIRGDSLGTALLAYSGRCELRRPASRRSRVGVAWNRTPSKRTTIGVSVSFALVGSMPWSVASVAKLNASFRCTALSAGVTLMSAFVIQATRIALIRSALRSAQLVSVLRIAPRLVTSSVVGTGVLLTTVTRMAPWSLAIAIPTVRAITIVAALSSAAIAISRISTATVTVTVVTATITVTVVILVGLSLRLMSLRPRRCDRIALLVICDKLEMLKLFSLLR
jgi:hypothetical protein